MAAEPQSISRAEVEHLARLSRLALTDDELDQYAARLDSILAHVAQVSEVAADDVPPTARTPRNWPTCCASTRWVPGLTTDEALSARRPSSRTGSPFRRSWGEEDRDRRIPAAPPGTSPA